MRESRCSELPTLTVFVWGCALVLATAGCAQPDDTEFSAFAAVVGSTQVAISSSNDDAEERIESGRVYLDSSDLDLGEDKGRPQLVALRFQLPMNRGDEVSEAFIQFEADEVGVAPAQLEFRVHHTPDSAPFRSARRNLSNRRVGGPTIHWNVPAWTAPGDAGADQKTPDLSALIQHSLDRSSWASGNHVTILIRGTGSRVAESFRRGAPTLNVVLASADVPDSSPDLDAGPPEPDAAEPDAAEPDAAEPDAGTPTCTGAVVTHRDAVPRPSSPRPGYLRPFVDPVFGSTVTRVTGDPGTAILGPDGDRISSGATWGTSARHHYSKDQAWNADGSLLILTRHRGGGTPSSVYLHGETYEPLFTRSISGEDRWHPTEPDVRLFVSGNVIGRVDVRTGEREEIAIPGYSNFRLVSEGNFSDDGNWVAPLAVNDAGTLVTFAYDIANRIKYPDIDLSHMGDISWVTISPQANYVVVHGVHDTSRNRRNGRDQNQNYDLDGNPVGPLWSGYGEPSHADMTIDLRGEEVMIGVAKDGPNQGGWIMRRLRDGEQSELVNVGPSHTSTRGLERLGWAIGTFPDGRSMFADEAVGMRVDGSIERFAHMNLVRNGYESEGHVSVSPDGLRVIWNSNWGDGDGPIGAYVADTRGLCR